MKRALKWMAIATLLLVLCVLSVPLSIYGYYQYRVSATPGSLTLAVVPTARNAKVNVFLGTGGIPWMCAHNTPGATTPFGMVRLAPDTAGIVTSAKGYNRSGYFYGDNKIIGFSHTRLVGADAHEGGVFRTFPSRDSKIHLDRSDNRSLAFSHKYESATPGLYTLYLAERSVLVELAATPRVGVHRYSFDPRESDAPHLLLDIASTLGGRRAENARVRILPETREVEGQVTIHGSFSGRYDGLTAYFSARFDHDFAVTGTRTGVGYTPHALVASGQPCEADLEFNSADNGPTVIEMRLGISYTSIENARQNLAAEAGPDKTFEFLAAVARDAWDERLGRIQIQGGTETQQRIFHTALYRAFHMPTAFNDVNGEYTGFDRAVHNALGFTYYTDMSLWDTCRTAQPLYYLIARSEARDMMISLVEMAKAGGCLPRWPSGAGYTNCMLGTPADIAVTEAYLKGIRGFDAEAAYQFMRQTALSGKPEGTRFAGREGLEHYLDYGYCPSDKMRESVAATLEFACEDNAIALLAKALGHDADADVFANHAQNYRNVWNPQRQFFDAKDSTGRFQKEFNPLKLTYTDRGGRYTHAYVEGSAWQWRWFVPHDPEGLVSLFKSKEYFVEELNTFFAKSNSNVGNWNPGPYYWHGNEPDIHAVYLFNAAGRPDLTQKWVRHILNAKYSDDYVGLDGNDDGGTLSSWYVFSALGFYPVCGTTRYEIGSPLFSRAVINMGDAKLTVSAPRNSPENIYVQHVQLNGNTLDRWWFTHDEIAQGGTLTFEMGPHPIINSPPSA
ncbi:MAG: hypothetical protein AMXMBFR84_29140 [Candidatus Hydrogenedentota bacterium]